MSSEPYWQEGFENALDAIGLLHLVEAMTPEQREAVGKSLAIEHDNYGLAHYSPPPSDFYAREETEWKQRYQTLEKEFEEYRRNAETAYKRGAGLRSDANISIGKYGEVQRWG